MRRSSILATQTDVLLLTRFRYGCQIIYKVAVTEDTKTYSSGSAADYEEKHITFSVIFSNQAWLLVFVNSGLLPNI